MSLPTRAEVPPKYGVDPKLGGAIFTTIRCLPSPNDAEVRYVAHKVGH